MRRYQVISVNLARRSANSETYPMIAAEIEAALLSARNEALEEAAAVADEREAFYTQRAQETTNANLSCERQYGGESCEAVALRIRALKQEGT